MAKEFKKREEHCQCRYDICFDIPDRSSPMLTLVIDHEDGSHCSLASVALRGPIVCLLTQPTQGHQPLARAGWWWTHNHCVCRDIYVSWWHGGCHGSPCGSGSTTCVVLMLDHRLRRWPNIKTTRDKCYLDCHWRLWCSVHWATRSTRRWSSPNSICGISRLGYEDGDIFYSVNTFDRAVWCQLVRASTMQKTHVLPWVGYSGN